MKIIFCGNHTVGVRTLKTLRMCAEVVGVVAHPEDPEDGVSYESVHEYAVECGLKVIRGTGKSLVVADFISAAGADLMWIADYRYLLPGRLLACAPLGAVNLHPSLLPKYRGRAPINWAILNGEETLGLTAHFIDEGMDTGDIIAQLSFRLRQDQDVGDALALYYPLYEDITRQVIGCFVRGDVPRRAQNHALATTFPKRTPADGLIDWSQPVNIILNLVRGVSKPYPGAFTRRVGQRLTIWKTERDRMVTAARCGEVISVGPGLEFHVACRDGVVRVKLWESEKGDCRGIEVGDVLV